MQGNGPDELDLGGKALRTAFRGQGEVVVVKPAGLSSELPGAARERAALATVARCESWPEARLPHRLDRVTSGFLLVARDAASAAFHARSIREGQWLKGYVARVASTEDPRRFVGRHRRFLRRDGRRAVVVHSGGDPAWLEILASAAAPGRPGEHHLAIRLLTGRFHQIRVMCADLGIPLVGDVDYGGPPGPLWLEHARFAAPASGGGWIDLFEPRDPHRESVSTEVLAALGSLALGSSKATT